MIHPNRRLEAFVIAILASGPLAFGLVEPWSLGIFQILCFTLLAAGIWIEDYPAESGTRTFDGVLLTTGGLACIGTLQFMTPAAVGGPTSPLPFTVSQHSTGIAVLKWLAYSALVYSASRAIAGPQAFRRLLWVIFLVGVFIAVTGIAQQGQGNKAIYGIREVVNRDPFGPYYNRNHAASLMVMSALIGCGLMGSLISGSNRRRAEGANGEQLARQGLVLFMLAIVAFGIYKTNSRGALLAVLPAALAGFLAEGIRSRRHRGVLAGTVCAAVGIALYFFHREPIWVGIVNGSLDLSPRYRISMYRSGLEILNDFPLFGIGLNGLQVVYPAYQGKIVAGFVNYLHSDWLELLVQAGAAGAVLCVSGLILQGTRVIRVFKEVEERDTRWLLAGAFAACVSFLLHSFGEFSFQIPANAAIFLTLASCLGRVRAGSAAPLGSGGPGNAVRGALLAACAAMVLLSSVPVVASIYALRSQYSDAAARKNLLEKAYRWDPSPSYQDRIANDFLLRAEEHPAEQTELSRSAVVHAYESIKHEPLHPTYGKTLGYLLWKLDRHDDAKLFLRRQKGG